MVNADGWKPSGGEQPREGSSPSPSAKGLFIAPLHNGSASDSGSDGRCSIHWGATNFIGELGESGLYQLIANESVP